jgi:PAS domain S-box-containing protein
MILNNTIIPNKTILEERLKGARFMVYYRWVFIAIILGLLIIQLVHGYKSETLHSLTLVLVYGISNIVLHIANNKKYDKAWLRFAGATLDVGIISFHLWHLSGQFDPIAVSAAATILLYPVMILLYTFRIDKKLLIYITLLSVIAYSTVFTIRYPLILDMDIVSLSITPLSQMFKGIYILFIGLLCVFLQSRLLFLIKKQTLEVKKQTEAEMLLQIEKQRSKHIEDVFQKEKEMNFLLSTEIKERKKIEQELIQSTEQLNSIVANLVGAASRCLNDETYTVKFYSEKIFQISGYTPDELIDNKKVKFIDIVHPDDRSYSDQMIAEAIEQKRPYSFEYRIIHKQGHVVWVHENGQAVIDSQGKVLFLDGISTDVSDRVRAEQSYKELTDFLPQTVYELDNKGYIVFANKAADELFGKGKVDETGKVHASQFFPEDENKRLREQGANIIPEAGQQYFVETVAIRKDGSHCPVLIYSTPIIRDGQLLGERGMIIDISERKKTELALENAKGELEQLNAKLEKTIEERTAELTEANTQLLKLQKENLQSQFDMLKQQVNPHFLFNSLNVLTSLIKINPALAESFTEQLAKVYRYVLENKDKDLVPVKTEMEFLNAYVFLLNIRFMGKVKIDVEFDETKEERMLLPLSLQMLIENAIKHNTFSKKSPLHIRLYINENEYFVVENNMQTRETNFASTGVGLKNIKNRYNLLTDMECSFENTGTHFVAKIPLLHN